MLLAAAQHAVKAATPLTNLPTSAVLLVDGHQLLGDAGRDRGAVDVQIGDLRV